MGRKRVHGSQFSRLNQPSVKKKKEITNENVKKIATRIEKTVDRGKNQQTLARTVNVYSGL